MYEKATFSRTIILGNSGSGKSWLSIRVAKAVAANVTDLDTIHWEPGGYNVARDKQLAIGMVREAAEMHSWVIEGVFGWLVQEAVPMATALIWLDIPTDECVANLRQRGMRGGGDKTSFAALLAWASDYPLRQTSSSFAGHGRIFATFPCQKLRLTSREDISRLLAEIGCF